MTWEPHQHLLGRGWLSSDGRFVILPMGPVFILFKVGERGMTRHDSLAAAQEAATG